MSDAPDDVTPPPAAAVSGVLTATADLTVTTPDDGKGGADG